MNKLDTLYNTASQNDIQVINVHFSDTKKAACMCGDCFKVIILDRHRIIDVIEETELLAEEVGHFETGALYIINATYNTPLGTSNRMKYEARAKQWAIREILPPEALQEAMYNVGGDYNMIAEYCGVSPESVYKAIEYYKSKRISFSLVD